MVHSSMYTNTEDLLISLYEVGTNRIIKVNSIGLGFNHFLRFTRGIIRIGFLIFLSLVLIPSSKLFLLTILILIPRSALFSTL